MRKEALRLKAEKIRIIKKSISIGLSRIVFSRCLRLMKLRFKDGMKIIGENERSFVLFCNLVNGLIAGYKNCYGRSDFGAAAINGGGSAFGFAKASKAITVETIL